MLSKGEECAVRSEAWRAHLRAMHHVHAFTHSARLAKLYYAFFTVCNMPSLSIPPDKVQIWYRISTSIIIHNLYMFTACM